MTSTPLIAACHCGGVRLEADVRPAAVTSCNCSICRRYGALGAYDTRATARLWPAEVAGSIRVRRLDGASSWAYLDE